MVQEMFVMFSHQGESEKIECGFGVENRPPELPLMSDDAAPGGASGRNLQGPSDANVMFEPRAPHRLRTRRVLRMPPQSTEERLAANLKSLVAASLQARDDEGDEERIERGNDLALEIIAQ